MSKYWKVGLIAVVVAGLAFGAVATVAAQGDGPPKVEGGEAWHGGPGFGQGRGPSNGVLAEYADIMHEAIAEFLGISTEELEQARQDGVPMHDLVAEGNLDFEELRTVMQAAREQMIEEALADGVISEDRAEWLTTRPHFRHGPGDHAPGDCQEVGPMREGWPGRHHGR